MIQVVLFVDGKHRDKMIREVAPSVGDTIVIDCGEMVKVAEVNHQWDDGSFVQANTVTVEGDYLFKMTWDEAQIVIDILDRASSDGIALVEPVMASKGKQANKIAGKLSEQLRDQGRPPE